MSLRIWALKPGELKPLSRAGLLLLGARCAMRVEPWLPPDTEELWQEGLALVTAAAFLDDISQARAPALGRKLSDQGAIACNRLASTDEPAGRCMNYATQTLARAIDAIAADARMPLGKVIIETAKMSASIPAVMAHAGRIVVPAGDAVEVACLAMWDAIRADVPAVAARLSDIAEASEQVRALRDCAAFWVGKVPDWASPR